MLDLTVRYDGRDSIDGRNPCLGLISTLITGPTRQDFNEDMDDTSDAADLVESNCIEQ